jgi:transcriptional regulator with XRE-family HTH domain
MSEFLPSIDQLAEAISKWPSQTRKSLYDDICGLDVSDTEAVRTVTRRLVAETHLSQDVLASAVGYSQSMLARYLDGTNSNIGIALVKAVRSVLQGNTLRPASAWVRDWDEFATNFGLSPKAKERAKELAQIPAHLVFCSPHELGGLVRDGYLRRSVLERIVSSYDDHFVLAELASIDAGTREKLSAIAPFPSGLDADRRKAVKNLKLSLQIEGVVFLAVDKLLAFLKSGAADAKEDDVVVRSAGKGIVQFTHALADLFKNIEANEDRKLRGHSLLDEEMARISKNKNHLGQLLDACKSKDQLRVLDLSNGYISQLKPLCDRIEQFPDVRVVDISNNNVDVTEMENVMRLGRVMAKRGGALVIRCRGLWPHPGDTTWRDFAAKALTDHQELAALLCVIWIPEDLIETRHWMRFFGGAAAALEDAIRGAHRKLKELRPESELENDE